MSEPIAEAVSETSMVNSWIKLGIVYGGKALLLLATIIIGLIVAKLARKITQKLVDRTGLEALLERLGVAQILYKFGIKSGPAKFGGQLVYWGTILATLFLGLEQLAIPGLTRALAALVAYLPNVVVAAALLLLGFVAGDALKSAIAPPDEEEPPTTTRRFLAQALHWGTIILSATIALEQLGVAVTLVHGIIKVSYAGVALSCALAVIIGARRATAHMIAGHYARKLLRVGDMISLGDGREGELKSFTSLHVLLQISEERELMLPYGELMNQTFELGLTEEIAKEDKKM